MLTSFLVFLSFIGGPGDAAPKAKVAADRAIDVVTHVQRFYQTTSHLSAKSGRPP